MWVTSNNECQLEEGDIIETDTRFLFVKHYAVIVIQNGQKRLAHYPFPRNPIIESISDGMENKNILRINRTGLKSEDIINKVKEIDISRHKWVYFNCEDYIKRITGIQIGLDQRVKWIIGVVVVVVVIVLVWNLSKSK